MARQLQLRRGTTSEHSTFTGAPGEVTVDTVKNVPVVHDGVTAGGFAAARESVVNTKVEKNADIVAGTATKVTYDSKGLVTAGTTLSATDIPVLDVSKITTGTLSVARGGTGAATLTGLVKGTGTTAMVAAVAGTDYVVPSGSITGNAGTATKLATVRSLAISGDITWTVNFDGSANVTAVGTLATITDSGTGTFKKISTDTKGRVTGTQSVTQSDITGLLGAGSISNSMLANAAVANLSGTNTGDQTITLTGDVTGSGTGSFTTTLSNSGVTAGTYSKLTVDAKGRVTAGLTQTMEDVPSASYKRSVKAATTANITLIAPRTIDGIALVEGDRVLVKNQINPSQNGIYIVNASTWTRSLDADTSDEIAGCVVNVDSGTINGGILYTTNFKTTDTIGTISMNWYKVLDDSLLLTSTSALVGAVKYNGTVAANGKLYGGTTTPTDSARLNYGGYFYPTAINLTGTADTDTVSTHVFVETDSDGFVRPKTLSNFKTEMFTSPNLTGTPTAPTAASTVSSTQLATTAFAVPRVTGIDNAIVRFDGTSGSVQNSGVIIDDNNDINITGGGSLIGSCGAGNIASNLSVGTGALQNNTTGYYNTAIGTYTLNLNTTGINNTANGTGALYSNTTGSSNTANGVNALQNNTTGYYNTAIGTYTLNLNTTGINNTANGTGALQNNTTGYNNTAAGVNALNSNTTGINNTANGVTALNSNTTFSNCSGFGYNAQVTASNQVQLGDAATTTYVYGTVQNRSDMRDKADIEDSSLGLDFISSLRPVSYIWDMREDYKTPMPESIIPKEDATDEEKEQIVLQNKINFDTWLEENKLSNIKRDGSKKRNRKHFGFIAQEVKALGVDFGGIQDHSLSGGEDVMSLGYDEFIAPMVKAIQELKAEIELLNAGAK